MYFSVDSIEAGDDDSSKLLGEESGCVERKASKISEESDVSVTDDGCVRSDVSTAERLCKTPSHAGGHEQVPVLSPWEKWVISKAEKERARREEEHQQKLQKQQVAKIQRKTELEKLQRSDKAYKEWLTHKTKTQTTSKQRQSRALIDSAKHVEERMQSLEARAKTSYDKWCAKKKIERQENEKLRLERQQKQLRSEQEKREKGAKAYRDWMKVNWNRDVENDWYGRMEEKRTF